MTQRTATPILCLTGPTAAGKSAAALALAQRWPIEIIVMDSATLYRGMDIGTAKPDRAEQARVRHHLIDILDPAQHYSAARFATDATRLIAEIEARGHRPLLCGGTLLYWKALREGLHDLPGADPQLRAELDARARRHGWPALHADLARVDPATAARLAPHDSQRLQRALEIFHTSGRPMSHWLAQPARPLLPGRSFVTLSLEPGRRDALHARIAQRFDAMLQAGLLEEVESLMARPDLHPGLPAIRCVGYRQLWEHLQGRMPLPEAREQAIAATRQLARRQLTWLRAQSERQRIDGLAADATRQVVDAVAQALKAPGPEPVWTSTPV
ncbi:tRNA (adenosine(37)-N6)-dimethylallyltransferase MiaA [Castellaniella sp.]|uniref:tRNA (adenosine(37)-N6)-dimethylallyltransferase MiaA n=1 Tax=Castellaniella sp. TaxID=1955812 RepID=UPI003560F12B